MKTITLMILIALTAAPAFAHEVQPPPMKESCDAAKWLGSMLHPLPVSDPAYWKIDALASKAFDECEKYQERQFSNPMGAMILPPCRVTKPGVIQCD